MKRLSMAATAFLLAIGVSALAQTPIFGAGNRLIVGNYNANLNSSDQVFVVQLEANGAIVVDEGHAVKYFQNKSADNITGPDWTALNFNDSAWADGVNGVGYNSSQTTTLDDDDDQGAIFNRFAPFTIPNAGQVSTLIFRADYDDAFVAWLNGVEIARSQTLTDAKVPEWNDFGENHESTNKPGPDPSRWTGAQSNIVGPAVSPDNPDGTIMVLDLPVTFAGAVAVEPAGKATMTWADLKRWR